MTDLGTLGGAPGTSFDHSQVQGIAGRGDAVVAGVSYTALGELHAFLWRNGLMTDLGTLGGCCSFSQAINARGEVVGSSTDALGERHAVLWR
jgi:probable HAF family extracellular repeat protein